MKKILIIADGLLAKHFLETVVNLKSNENQYTIVAFRETTLPDGIENKIPIHFFDPTSFVKLSKLFEEESFYQVFLILNKKVDTLTTYKNIRKLNKDIFISMLDEWSYDNQEDPNLTPLHSKEVLTRRLIDHLPNMPAVAQNVGLGNGEIMEIQVPVGSSYLYRHIASIEQKDWRIVAIYRNGELHLARSTLMIRPSDSLLVIGDPDVLRHVYKSVKQELGQFPNPFGKNLYALVDMKGMSELEIETIINDALLLHSNINSKKLYIRVINPTVSKLFEKIKSYESSHITVNIEYHETDCKEVLEEDTSKRDIGLIVVNLNFFEAHKKILFEQKLPVFKIGVWGFSALKNGVILADSSKEIEKESSVILDFCSQLDFEITLYDFDPDNEDETKNLVDHFENLSKLFGKEVEIVANADKNPLVALRNRQDFIQFVPFYNDSVNGNFFDIFSTSMNKLSYKLQNNYQLFIPIL